MNQSNLEAITGKRQRELITATVNAIEGFVQFSIIALGMLQLVGLIFGNEIATSSIRFMRTRSNETPSERTVADFMRKSIFSAFRFSKNLSIAQIILARKNIAS